jgi:hypothetical protein
LGHRLLNEIFSDVPHRQWVFTMPKRLRILFRFDRRLLGALCRLAYESICKVMQQASADDQVGQQRLTEYIVRCPFSLARMIKVTDDGKVIYRTGKSKWLRFPEHGDDQLKAGTSRNFQVFGPLEFLAEVTHPAERDRKGTTSNILFWFLFQQAAWYAKEENECGG